MSPAVASEECAALIVACRGSTRKLDGRALARFTPNEEHGYAVQRLVGAQLEDAGLGPVAGYKLGMTSPALLRQFGISEPLYGLMHTGGRRADRTAFERAAHARPLGFECEIAITMAAALRDRGTHYDAASVSDAIGTFHAAIEIVENRFETLEGVAPWIVVADGVLHHAYALGPGHATMPADTSLEGELWLGEERLASGRSDNLHGGGPVEALVWLANKLVTQGRHLAAGDVVLCGSVAPAVWPVRAMTGSVRARIAQLGEVTLALR